MYISSRDTMAEAFEAFKTFPKLKQLIVYNLIPMGVMFLWGVLAVIGGYEQDQPISINPYIIMSILLGLSGMMALFYFYYLSSIKIVEYYQRGAVFNNFQEFLTPGQSMGRLFWKTAILPMLIVFLFVLFCGLVSAGLTMLIGPTAQLLMALGVIAFFIWVIPKFTVVIPYLIKHTEQGLRNAFSFSNDYVWYLMRVLFWISLTYIGLEVVNMIINLIGSLIFSGIMNAVWTILVGILYTVAIAIIYVFQMFVFTNTYFKIAKVKGT